jgi:peroxiredoxin
MKRILAFFTIWIIGFQGQGQWVAPVVKSMQLPNIADGYATKVLSQVQPSIVLFYSPECPMCQSYTLTIKRLSVAFPEAFHWVVVFAGKGYSTQEIIAFRDKYQFNFTLLADTAFTLANALKATVTPEVYLISKEGKILYQGAVDNWLMELGKKRPAATKHYLAEAMEATLAQRKIVVSKTTAKGCLINDY